MTYLLTERPHNVLQHVNRIIMTLHALLRQLRQSMYLAQTTRAHQLQVFLTDKMSPHTATVIVTIITVRHYYSTKWWTTTVSQSKAKINTHTLVDKASTQQGKTNQSIDCQSIRHHEMTMIPLQQVSLDIRPQSYN